MSPVQIGVIGCLVLFGLLFTSMPVAFAMIASGVLGFALIINPQAAFSMVIAELFETFSSYNLTVIPLFVMMGQVAFHAGISKRLFHTAYVWMGHLKGGLAMATVGACAGFGAICGSGPATAATMASVALPEMKRYGYADSLAAGTVAAGGSLGMLIPPSVVFIVYALMTEQSIGDLFLAGIVPGILIATMFCLNIYVRSSRDKTLGPAGPRHSWKERIISLNGVVETLILFLLVMGGMFLGLFTPIEAAAIGAAGSFLIAALQKELNILKMKKILLETVRTSSMIFFIVAAATIFGRFLAVSRIPFVVAQAFVSLPLPGEITMFLIILFFLVAGCFIDALALMLLTIPIFFPVVQELGFDPVWFGVIVVVITQMGVITPPVGVNVYVVSGIERDIPLPVIFKGAMPFLGMLVLAAVILILFPQICLFLPGLFH
ncbi:TRAP transporter large permease [Oceanispirochaeta sp.]|jgi:C4-dicarboxylate transporter DctM subunit|uniref:TRAP transporter large permease n=1 Tax=Oceanispirochaeta sp. TaxID=2035350 RepID=UPI002639FAFD|nr:TRAP transporter large permease [Oceanispirochaeta sp.]MDA3955276.1 TRAP transporter large permease [Oceanispirochaeta sp.]